MENYNPDRMGNLTRFWQHAMPRRQFITKAAGTFGLVLSSGLIGSGLLEPQLAHAANRDPKPIPGGFQIPGNPELFHALDTRCGFEPSSITDFMGHVGLARIQGNGTRTDTNTGNTTRLFYDADMRFMQGQYLGVDGRLHTGTYCLLWLDLSEGQGGPAVASINPGNVPGGLLWTMRVPSISINLHPNTSNCSMKAAVVTKDFGNVNNAFVHGDSVPVIYSYHVQWIDNQRKVQIQDKAQGYRGEFTESLATITCSVQGPGYTFVSDPPDPSGTLFAEYGREHNDVFQKRPFTS